MLIFLIRNNLTLKGIYYMKNRSPIAVALLGFPTLGIYWWYWQVKTKTEMNSLGEKIPTAWFWLIPYLGYIYWIYLYSKGVNNVTKGKLSTAVSFLLIWLLGFIGFAIVQDAFNSIAEASPAPAPQANPVPASPTPPAKLQ
jgi:Domain of unknown function (DUF4234)